MVGFFNAIFWRGLVSLTWDQYHSNHWEPKHYLPGVSFTLDFILNLNTRHCAGPQHPVMSQHAIEHLRGGLPQTHLFSKATWELGFCWINLVTIYDLDSGEQTASMLPALFHDRLFQLGYQHCLKISDKHTWLMMCINIMCGGHYVRQDYYFALSWKVMAALDCSLIASIAMRTSPRTSGRSQAEKLPTN